MDEYIKRGALIKHIEQCFGEISTPFVVREIKNFPTADVVEVVRCIRCKHSKKLQDPTNPETIFRYCLIDGKFIDNNHFCSHGERKCDNG